MIIENNNGRVTQVFTVQFDQINNDIADNPKSNEDQLDDQGIAKGVDINVVNSRHLSPDSSPKLNKYY